MFNPAAPALMMMRQMIGGNPEATAPSPDAFDEAMFTSSEEMRPFFEMMPVEYTVDDFARITVPALILAGDRDEFCTPEDGVAAYRKLQQGELAILPGVGHFIPPTKIQLYVDFLQRHPSA